MEYTDFILELSKTSDQFQSVVLSMMSLLDETDGDDYFGTEGWKHHLGIE